MASQVLQVPECLKDFKLGVHGLKCLKPLRKPGELVSSGKYCLSVEEQENLVQKKSTSGSGEPQAPPIPGAGRRLIARHSYKGQNHTYKEFSFKCGDMFNMLGLTHDNNGHWWRVSREGGEEGVVPASYMQLHSEQVQGLPWLENKSLDAPKAPPVNAVYKPYKPTYDLTGEKGGTSRYECKLCNKFFNGPQPYSAHMYSKAHKEEEEMEAHRQALGV